MSLLTTQITLGEWTQEIIAPLMIISFSNVWSGDKSLSGIILSSS